MARRTFAQLNLYSFQDVVTATIGILLITVLMLILTVFTGKEKEAKRAEAEFNFSQKERTKANDTFEHLQNKLSATRSELESYLLLRRELAEYINAELQTLRDIKSEFSFPTLNLQLPKGDLALKNPLILVVDGPDCYSVGEDGRPDSLISNTRQIWEILQSEGHTAILALYTPEALLQSNHFTVGAALENMPHVIKDVIPSSNYLILADNEK